MEQHFTEDRWSDLVRGVLPAEESAALRQHLEKGCEQCRQSFRLWRLVADVANGEIRHEVPEALMHSSRAAYVEWRRLYLLPQRARIARLVFDSLLAPLPSGVRSEATAPRRILWEFGQWSCDLRVEPLAGARISLAGQIVAPGSHAGLPVLLLRANALEAETTANQFGEFQLEFGQANGLRIYFDVPGNRPVGILLPDLENPLTAGEIATE
jgi:hypothetical protein